MRREEFRKVNGVDRKNGELEEAHDGDQPERLARLAVELEGTGSRNHRGNESKGEGLFSTQLPCHPGCGQHAAESADLEGQQSPTGPLVDEGSNLLTAEAFCEVGCGQNGANQFGGKKADAPQSNDARTDEEHPDDRVFTPTRIREEFFVRESAVFFEFTRVLHFLPAVGLLHPHPDDKRKRRRDRADNEHPSPGISQGNDAVRFEYRHRHSNESGGDVSNRGECLQSPQRSRAGSGWHDFRQQGYTYGEFTADTEPCDESIEREIPETDGERAQSGAQGIDQDGDHHRLGSADTVTEYTEDQSTRRPTCQEHRGRIATPEHWILSLLEQGPHSRHARQGKQLLVQTVKEPAQGSDGEDEPVVTGQSVPPAAGRRG